MAHFGEEMCTPGDFLRLQWNPAISSANKTWALCPHHAMTGDQLIVTSVLCVSEGTHLQVFCSYKLTF